MFRIRTYLVFVFVLALSFGGRGQVQQSTIDSLENVYRATSDPEKQFEVLTSLCRILPLIDPVKGLKYGEQALDIELKDGHPITTLLDLYSGLGLNAYYAGNNPKALNYYTLGLQLRDQEKLDDQMLAPLYNNYGLLFYNMQDYRKAAEQFANAVKALEKTGDNYSLLSAINNLGNCYYMVGMKKEAKDYYKYGLEVAGKMGDKASLCASHSSVAFMALDEGDYATARAEYKKAIALASEINDANMWAYCWTNVARIYEQQNKQDSALAIYNKIINKAQETKNSELLLNMMKHVANMYYRAGDFENSHSYLSSYLNLSDSIRSIESERAIEELKEYYEAEKKEQRIKTLAQDNEIKAMLARSAQLKAEQKANELVLSQKDAAMKEAQLDKQRAESEKRQQELEVERKDKELAEAGLKERNAQLAAKQAEQYALYGGIALVLLLAAVAFISFVNKRKDNKLIAAQRDEVQSQKTVVEEQKAIVEEKNKEITDSIAYAQRLQGAILPPLKLVKEHLPDSFILFKPKDMVAGDFYWMEIVDDTVIFAAADCTGHGVPGAMVSVVCNNALNRAVREFGCKDPASILDKTRELVIETFEKSEEDVKDGMDIAVCAINKNTRVLQFAGANNPLYHLKRLDEEVTDRNVVNDTHYIKEVKADKQPIGKYAEQKPFTNFETQLAEGDIIYTFSDGFADQFGGEKGKKFKYKPFKKLLLNLMNVPMEDQRGAIDKAFEDWRGQHEQVDDVCVIGVRV